MHGTWTALFCLVWALHSCAGCDHGWYSYGSSCFYFSHTDDKRSWDDAKSHCHSHYHAALAEIHSSALQSFLEGKAHSHFSGHKTLYSVGASDKASEGTWVWGSGLSMNYHHWAPGYPDNWHEHDQDCLTINSDLHWKWDDVSCGYGNPGFNYICEKKASGSHRPLLG